MTEPVDKPITIYQGATFDKKYNWYGGGRVTREIDNVTPGCPTRITISAHGLSANVDTPVYIEDVKSPRELNTKGEEVVATWVDADNFDVPTGTRGQSYTAGTGCVHYYLPKDLTDYTARMDIRESIDDDVPLVSLVSPADLVIDLATAEIQIIITDEVTAALSFDSGVYDLELEDSTGHVTRLMGGEVTFVKEVTRP
jgi:hypothetical protein